MSYEDNDTTAQVQVESKPQAVTFTRRAGGAPSIMVEFIENGVSVVRHVPQATIDAGWPGTSKTLKAHLLQIIGLAE